MAIAVAEKADPGASSPWENVSLYHMVVGASGLFGVAVTAFGRVEGPPPSSSLTGDVVITVDWSSLSTIDATSTGTVAEAVTDTLLNSGPSLGFGGLLPEIPFHLIGHSRGGSLVAEIAGDLGKQGIWVDQVTTLDPHPLGIDPGPAGIANIYNNVVFADNYYESTDLLSGTVNGADNTGPLSFPGGTESCHSEVHAYYHGTISRSVSTDSDGGAIVDSWYNSRATTGFDYSLIDGGSRPSDGLSSLAGTSYNAVRVPVSLTTFSPWSNIGSLSLTDLTSSAGLISNNDLLSINYRYQDIDGGGSINFFLDNDQNPYDGSTRWMGSRTNLPFTGPTPNSQSNTQLAIWSNTSLTTGFYYIYAQIVSPTGQARYAYLPQPIYITANSDEIVTKRWTGDVDSSWSNASNWTPGGVPNGGDRTTIQPNLTSSVDISSGVNTTDVQLLSGTMTWSGGDILDTNLTVAAGATLNITGTNSRLWLGGSLSNSGTVVWSSGTLNSGSNFSSDPGLVINNLAGGLFDAQGDGNYPLNYIYSNQPTFNNAGTFRRDNGSGVTYFGSIIFNNTGSVEVQSGRLQFGGTPFNNDGSLHVAGDGNVDLTNGGTSSGSFTADSGANVNLIGGNFTLNNGSSFAGAGFYGITGGVYIHGTVSGSNFQMASGQLGAGSNLTLIGTMTWSGGDILDTNLTVAAGATLNITGTNSRLWLGGSLSNSGTVVWSSGTLNSGSNFSSDPGLVINNLAGGLFDAQGDGNYPLNYIYSNQPTFNNAGTFRRDNGSGVTYFGSIIFNNTGSVEVQSGRLQFGGTPFNNDGSLHVAGDGNVDLTNGGTSSGSFTADSGANVNLIGGNFTLNNGSSFAGAGFYGITGGVYIHGTVSGSNFQMASGQLGAGSNLTLIGTMTWSGGDILDTNLTVAAGATLNITGTNSRLWLGGSLSNSGTVVWSSGTLNSGSNFSSDPGLVINNLAGGLFDAQGDGNYPLNYIYSNQPTFNNAGTFRRDNGSGVTYFGSIIFNNTGSVEVQSGRLQFGGTPFNNDGSLHVAGDGNVDLTNGGTSSGSFTADSGANVNLIGGNFTLNNGSSFAGAGFYGITGGVYIHGTVSGSNFQMASGQLGAGSNLTLIGTMTWSGGDILDTNLTVAAGATLNITGTNSRLWLGGSLSNSGTVVWSSGTLNSGSNFSSDPGLVINNLAGGLFDAQGDGNYPLNYIYSNQPTFNNAGTFRRDNGSGVTYFGSIIFNNTGSVEVQSGRLQFGGTPFNNDGSLHVAGDGNVDLTNGGTSSGSFTADSGSAVDLRGGTFTLNAGNGFGGPGLFTVNSGVSINGRMNIVGELMLNQASAPTIGLIDLHDNDLIVPNGNLADLAARIKLGENLAATPWSGTTGISSSSAVDSLHRFAVGLIQNKDLNGNPVYGATTAFGPFDGQSPSASDVLVKFTYYGDADLNGKIDAADYSHIDNGANSAGTLSGWVNGDFNYDGVINGADYTLIDNAANNQTAGVLSTEPAAVNAVVLSVASSAGLKSMDVKSQALAGTKFTPFSTTPISLVNLLQNDPRSRGIDSILQTSSGRSRAGTVL